MRFGVRIMSYKEMKPALNIDEQVKVLKDRGIEIKDDEQVKIILNRITYYRLSGYTWCFIKDGKLPVGISFEQIYNAYEFDRELKYLLIKILEEIEITFRSRVANLLAIKYGPIGYRERGNFESTNNQDAGKDFYLKTLENIDNEINRSNEVYVEHYKKTYGEFPIWVAAETMSFGCVAKVFSLMKKEDADEISKMYGLKSYILKSWMKHLAYIKNVCAHYSRLYGRINRTKPVLSNQMKKKGYDQGRTLATLHIIKSITRETTMWGEFKQELYELMDKYDQNVDLMQLGFIDSWKQVLDE